MCSGGKDSIASLILDYTKEVHESHVKGEIIFAEVMYDLKRDISGENPEHIQFVKEKLKPTMESWGYKFTILRAETDYLTLFNHTIQKGTTHPEHVGMTYGFPVFGLCNVKRDCKIKPVEQYLKQVEEPYIQVLGIAADEEKRLCSMHKNPQKVSLLEKYGYTEAMAYDLCKEYGLLSPTYSLAERYPITLPSGKREKANRGGCWMCCCSHLCEHLFLKQNNPALWEEFISLENTPNLAFDKWSCYNVSLHERDRQLENAQKYGIIC